MIIEADNQKYEFFVNYITELLTHLSPYDILNNRKVCLVEVLFMAAVMSNINIDQNITNEMFENFINSHIDRIMEITPKNPTIKTDDEWNDPSYDLDMTLDRRIIR